MHSSHAQTDEADIRAERMLHDERVRADRVLTLLCSPNCRSRSA